MLIFVDNDPSTARLTKQTGKHFSSVQVNDSTGELAISPRTPLRKSNDRGADPVDGGNRRN
jgi:hypothetical protein